MKSLFLVGIAQAISISSASSSDNQKIVESIEGKFNGWGAGMEGFPGTQNSFGNWFDPYTRKIPVNFQGDSADEVYYPVDKFTQNMVTNHAREAVDQSKPGGKRTDSFHLTKAQAKNAALEVLNTHFSLKGAEAQAFLNANFDKAWNHYDVNGAGQIDYQMMGTLYRYMTKSLGEIDLQ